MMMIVIIINNNPNQSGKKERLTPPPRSSHHHHQPRPSVHTENTPPRPVLSLSLFLSVVTSHKVPPRPHFFHLFCDRPTVNSFPLFHPSLSSFSLPLLLSLSLCPNAASSDSHILPAKDISEQNKTTQNENHHPKKPTYGRASR
jgi:hypothetical protein